MYLINFNTFAVPKQRLKAVELINTPNATQCFFFQKSDAKIERVRRNYSKVPSFLHLLISINYGMP